MNIIKKNEGDRFTLKSRKKYEDLVNSPIYVKSELYLKLPDDFILSGFFNLFEKISDIMDFVRFFLKKSSNVFYIIQTPPLRRFTDPKATIDKLCLFPNAILICKFDDAYDGLDNEKIKGIMKEIEMPEVGGVTWGDYMDKDKEEDIKT